MLKNTFLFLLILSASIASAQYNSARNSKWAFGQGAGLNFSGGAPVGINTAINSSEGCASVCDAAGNMLFYTDGANVYEASGTVMPSGSSIIPYVTSSTTQGALIVPVLSNSNRYYIFSIEQMEDYWGGDLAAPRMFYSIVDMTLNGGLGDLVPGSVGIPLVNPVAEKAIAIPGNNCNIWVLCHGRETNEFKAYEVTAAGVSTTPVISTVGTRSGYFAYIIGVMKVSPDYHKLAVQSSGIGVIGTATGTELYDFDQSTGIVSNCKLIDSVDFPYGAEFSPNSSKLYTQQWDGTTSQCIISQFDVTAATTAAIVASRVDIINSSGGVYTDLKLAPDSKIYLNSLDNTYSGTLDCISAPNATGLACNYITGAVFLAPGSTTAFGLPNVYMDVAASDTTYGHTDTAVCITAGSSVIITAPSGSAYSWYDGTTAATHTVTAYGNYVVGVTHACNISYDTIKVVAALPDTTSFHHDTAFCSLSPGLTLSAPSGYTSWNWNTGATTSVLPITSVGTYWVSAVNTCGSMRNDTFHVTTIMPDTTHISHDTTVCATVATLLLTAPAGYTTYLWNTGAGGATFTASLAGAYYVYCHTGCSTLVDTIHVIKTTPGITYFAHDTSLCFPGSFILQGPAGYPAYHWQDGSITSSYTITAPGTYWVDAANSCTSELDTFHVDAGSVAFSLGNDRSVCIDQKLVIPISGPGVTYLWQNGSTDSVFYTYYSGVYWATVTWNGCSFTDSVNIDYYHLQQNIPDTFICKGTPIALHLTATVPDGGSVLWNNGSTDPVITVTDSGTYWVFVKKDECEILDTVHVVTGYCDCWLQVPDAFTPNDDGRNDVIRPSIQPGCTISGYQFSIYNRWGQQVFTSDVRGEGWDGTFNGVKQEIGTYMYALQYFAGVYDKPVTRSGSITLLR